MQFIADTIGARVPGRLTPFVRGWISTAADVHHHREVQGASGKTASSATTRDVVPDPQRDQRGAGSSAPRQPARRQGAPSSRVSRPRLADAVIRIMDLARPWLARRAGHRGQDEVQRRARGCQARQGVLIYGPNPFWVCHPVRSRRFP